MTFGALPAWEAWLLLAAAVAGAAGLFLLKLRPPRILVSSLTLWRRVLDQPRPRTWWERVRRAVSLVATVAIALGLALAFVRPAFAPAPSGSVAGVTARASAHGTRLEIVIDSSWSMLARTSAGATRWDRAIAEARAIAAGAGGDEVAIATTADGLVEEPTTDVALIEAALDRIAPAGGEGSPWPRVAGARAVHFITDGAVARTIEPGVIVHSVFESAPNVAITAFEVRPASASAVPGAAADASAGEAYLEVANYAPSGQTVHVTLARGAAMLFDRRVEMTPGEAVREIVPLDRTGDARLSARVDAPANALVADDTADAWIELARPIAVVVVSDRPAPLALLLGRDPDVRVTAVTPGAYQPGAEDVTIFDRWLPPNPPTRPALCLAPPSTSWLGMRGAEEIEPRWTLASSHPALRGVDPLTMALGRARSYDGPGLTPVARSDRGTPLVYAAEAADRRLLVVTFGTGESNLPFAPGFPVLVANAIEWLARPEVGAVRRPGVATLAGGVTRVVGPNGRAVPTLRVGESVVVRLKSQGLYVVESAGARSVAAVNIGAPDISNLQRTTLTASAAIDSAAPRSSPRAWWVLCLAAALVLAAAEWATWLRRITV